MKRKDIPLLGGERVGERVIKKGPLPSIPSLRGRG